MDSLAYYHAEYLKKVELPESIINIAKLIKIEKMMITQRELVEELRCTVYIIILHAQNLYTVAHLQTGPFSAVS